MMLHSQLIRFWDRVVVSPLFLIVHIANRNVLTGVFEMSELVCAESCLCFNHICFFFPSQQQSVSVSDYYNKAIMTALCRAGHQQGQGHGFDQQKTLLVLSVQFRLRPKSLLFGGNERFLSIFTKLLSKNSYLIF